MICREGLLPVAAFLGGAVLAMSLDEPRTAMALLVVAGLLAYQFGERVRNVPDEPLAVIAPVDGRVLSIDRGPHPWCDEPVTTLRIGVRWPGVVPLRSPVEGRVVDLLTGRRGGGRGSPDDYGYRVRTDEGVAVLYVVHSDWPLSRFRSTVSPGERVGQGRRCGFVYFATRVDVCLPETATLAVASGRRVRGGETVIAELPDVGRVDRS